MHSILKSFAAFAAILTVFSVIQLSCKPKTKDDPEALARRNATPSVVLVKTIKLRPSTFYHELISNGTIVASSKAVVPFKINGIINRLSIRNGQKVVKGDLLAVIDDFDYSVGLIRARQALEAAEINYRDNLLSSYGTTDTVNLSPAKVKVARIRSGINDAITGLRIAEYNYSNTRIIAPISGRVADLEAKEWNPSQNYKFLCTIVEDYKMEVVFPIIESEYEFINEGMTVSVIPFFTDSVRITGVISEINPRVSDNGQVIVRARFNNPGKLIEGMNVRVAIRKAVANRLVIPKEALVIRQGRDVVFVRQDSLAIWKYVTVEFENSNTVSISEGLDQGDLVIVRGNINLAHETKVREE